jgi:hypothetical protein
MPIYTLADWDPTSGQSMEDWARQLRDQGWCVWAGPGTWVTIDGRRVWRISLRLDEPPDRDRPGV